MLSTKNSFLHLQPTMKKKNSLTSYFILLSCFTFLLQSITAEECTYVSDCKCIFRNGSIIDVSSLANHNGARWINQKSVTNDTYSYSYNPCIKFSMGPSSTSQCQNVAVCQISSSGNDYFDCGDRLSSWWNNDAQSLVLRYFSTHDSTPGGIPRQTNITFICEPEQRVPELIVEGENKTGSGFYEMRLTSRCACPDLCREYHLSAGSVLVIIFLIFVTLYLILGIVHSSLTRGAHGWELIPHHEFWVDFPLLVRDGCVFVMSGFKADTAYERI